MEHWAIVALAAAWERSLPGCRLESVRPAPGEELRFRFENGGPRAVAVCLDPAGPWVGRPTRGPRTKKQRGATPFDRFVRICRERLVGAVVDAVHAAGDDRRLEIGFRGGARLIFETGAGAPRLLLVDPDGLACAAAGRDTREGERFRPRKAPARLLLPWTAGGAELDARFPRGTSARELSRACFGVGRAVAEIVVAESDETGESVGSVLARRLDALLRGESSPCLETPVAVSPLERAYAGEGIEDATLLPWQPGEPAPGRARFSGESADETLGLFFTLRGATRRREIRVGRLLAMIRAERERASRALAKARVDLERLGDPRELRRFGEALLAGLDRAERDGDVVRVPDPEEPERLLAIPASGSRGFTELADLQFARSRKASRGRESTARREEAIGRRVAQLSRVEERLAGAPVREEELVEIEGELRSLGLPAGLELPGTRPVAKREAARRLRGFRLFRTEGGGEILVGKDARANDRLTFGLAGPDDFWLHAKELPGAHVVLRNPDRSPRPEEDELQQAAAVAARFSDGRSDSRVDVIWTQRKHVRRARGGRPGAVVVKRSQTVRVAPRLPDSSSGFDS